MTYGKAAQPNCRKRHIWSSHGHVITLPMGIPGVEISAIWFFAV